MFLCVFYKCSHCMAISKEECFYQKLDILNFLFFQRHWQNKQKDQRAHLQASLCDWLHPVHGRYRFGWSDDVLLCHFETEQKVVENAFHPSHQPSPVQHLQTIWKVWRKCVFIIHHSSFIIHHPSSIIIIIMVSV